MKTTLSLLAILLLAGSAFAQTPISPDQAAKYVGKTVSISGKVTQVHVDEKATFLNMGGIYPNQAFTIVTFPRYGIPNSALTPLEGKTITVTGPIRTHKGKPQIILEDLGQLAR